MTRLRDPRDESPPAASFLGPIDDADLHVMTFNIRRPMEGRLRRARDRWSTRAPAVAAMLRSERPAIIGLQEALPRAIPVVRAALGDGHRILGHGRGPDGRGEGTPLLFDSERLALRAWRQEALSDHPETAGSRGWGNPFPRTLVWAEFRDRRSDASFLVVNTHLDPLSARSRIRSVDRIRSLVRDRGLPAVVLGDLNAGAASTTVSRLLGENRLVDTWTAARERRSPEWGTYPHYARPRVGGRRIDWIVATPDVDVVSSGIDSRRFAGIAPSDHLAVHSLLRIGDGA